MKKLIFMLLAALPIAALAQHEYTLNGYIGKVKLPATAYVVYQESGGMKFDSAAVQPNGRFTIKGKVLAPLKAYVMVTPAEEKLFSRPVIDQVGVYLERGIITFSTPDSLNKAKVGGTPLNEDQQAVVNLLAPLTKQEHELLAALRKTSGQAKEHEKLQKLYSQLKTTQLVAQEKFIQNHPGSLVSLSLLRVAFSPVKDAEKANALFDSLSPEIRSSKAGEAYLSAVGRARSLEVGDMAPDFVMKNTKGEDIALSAFKGKYVLIDFWASWCVPCRAENPNVVKAYEKFKTRNFTILGVSLDDGDSGKQKWIDAIAKDGLNWEQVSDLRGWGSYAAQLYHVNAIPANFLLDPTGKIIGKNLRGAQLEVQLQSKL